MCSDGRLTLCCTVQVRDLLRASVRQAASTAIQKQSPQKSTVLWSLLRTSLKQQGEALLDLQSVKAAAKEAHREVCPPSPRGPKSSSYPSMSK